jgi:hypothetical protein
MITGLNQNQKLELVDYLLSRKIHVYGMIYSNGNKLSCYGQVANSTSKFYIKVYDTDLNYLVGQIFKLNGATVQLTGFEPEDTDGDRTFYAMLTFKIIMQ